MNPSPAEVVLTHVFGYTDCFYNLYRPVDVQTQTVNWLNPQESLCTNGSDVNKATSYKAKAKATGCKAKNLGFKAKAEGWYQWLEQYKLICEEKWSYWCLPVYVISGHTNHSL